ncbi:MAG: hypothetical protein LBG27_13475 [Spirochaetaceae bacterium]|jgi:hypothetical protein|nr:hypothetical protein [Spirochaetaceae bacterium]
MNIVILDSAYKHGLSEQSIYSCLLNFRNDMVLDDSPPKYLFAGFDHLGNALEIIAVEDTGRDRLVVGDEVKEAILLFIGGVL